MNKGAYKNRIISEEKARKLIAKGYFAIDPHCHSAFSYDVPDSKDNSPENVIGKQISLGLRPTLTDHDTLNGHKFLRKRGIKAISAVELTIKPVKAKYLELKKPMHTLHINIFSLNEKDLKILSKIASKGDLDELVAYMKKRNLDWMYNHPFWHENKERLNWREIPRLAKYYFDVIEVNCGATKMINDLTVNLAEKQEKGLVCSTDSHTGNPGWAYTIAEGKNFKEFWKNVKQGNMYIVRKDMTAIRVVKESSDMIHQVFGSNTNTIKERKFSPDLGLGVLNKFAKLVTSGRLKDRQIIKKIMSMMLQTINYSAGLIIAWRFYITKKNNQIESIRRNFENMLKKINAKKRHRENNRKNNNKKNNILYENAS